MSSSCHWVMHERCQDFLTSESTEMLGIFWHGSCSDENCHLRVTNPGRKASKCAKSLRAENCHWYARIAEQDGTDGQWRARLCALCYNIIMKIVKDASYYSPESLLDRGLRAISDLVDSLAVRPPEDQDLDHAKALSVAVRTCCEVSRESRESLIATSERNLHDGDLQRLLVAYLSRLPEAERAALLRSTDVQNRATLA